MQNKTFPKWGYSPTEAPKIFEVDAMTGKLPDGWHESPASIHAGAVDQEDPDLTKSNQMLSDQETQDLEQQNADAQAEADEAQAEIDAEQELSSRPKFKKVKK